MGRVLIALVFHVFEFFRLWFSFCAKCATFFLSVSRRSRWYSYRMYERKKEMRLCLCAMIWSVCWKWNLGMFLHYTRAQRTHIFILAALSLLSEHRNIRMWSVHTKGWQHFLCWKMAKTRSQRAKEFAKELKVNKIKKINKKPATAANKKPNEQEKDLDIQSLLQLCRPFSICLDRIDRRDNGKTIICMCWSCFYCVIFFSFLKSQIHPLYKPKKEALRET